MEPSCGGTIGSFHWVALRNTVGGPKTVCDEAMVEKCVLLCGLKWLQLSNSNKGRMPAPNERNRHFVSLNTMVSSPFLQDGLQHSKKCRDTMVKWWEKCCKEDPTHGTRKDDAKLEWDGNKK